ncbi:MAG: helix-turn-helix transcriptional regulator [Bacteroidales bacterium]|nr:helix-turn-helix transcriptional regulator [Bacteroidales bacterium]MBQ9194302.1 helix-turn-helix transcriptional regulator [Bacteroidales bacterium]
MNIGHEIKTRRKVLSISQSDLADMAEISLATLKNIERGVGNPSFETVEKLLEVLGLEMIFRVRNPFDRV